MPHVFSTREIGDILGVDTWRIRRLFEAGVLPEPPRFAGKRAIPRETIPAIVDALRARGWLPSPDDGSAQYTPLDPKQACFFGQVA